METTERESCKHSVNPERKYIRLQEVGLSFVLASPVAAILASMFDLDVLVPGILTLLIMIGIAFFSAGHIGRKGAI